VLSNKWDGNSRIHRSFASHPDHSLFKSLLFYSAGNVLQATNTVNIEHLGGLDKKDAQNLNIIFDCCPGNLRTSAS